MMRLFPEVVSALAIGCDGWDWQDDAWRPHRMPAVMRPLYESAEGSRVRMLCTSSVRLRFVSETRTLGIQLRFGVAARQIFKGALVVDGRKPIPFGPDQATSEWQGVV